MSTDGVPGGVDPAWLLLDYHSNAQYLLHRLVEGDEVWEKVTSGVLMKLGREFGPSTVVLALQEVRMAMPKVRSPVGYLRSVCVGLSVRNLAFSQQQETDSPIPNDGATTTGAG